MTSADSGNPASAIGATSTVMTAAAVAIGAVSAMGHPTAIKMVCLVVVALIVTVSGVSTAVSLVCVALPFAMMEISVGQSNWSPLELALLACWLATGASVSRKLIQNRDWRDLKVLFEPADLVFLILAFALTGALSILWIVEGGVRADSVREFRRVILEPLILVPAVALVRRRSELRLIVPWLVVPAVVISFLAIAQIALQSSVVEIGRIARPIGTFTHPNNLAFYLERVVWFAPLLVAPLGWLPLSSRRFAAGCIVVGCLLTLSRGALIAIVIGGLVYFWEYVRPRWRRYAIGAVGVGALTFASRAALGDGGSSENRGTIWRASIDMLRDHPMRGVGLDQFFSQYGRRYLEPAGWPERYTSHPHNILLDFWLRLGLPGVLLLWALIEAIVRRVRHAIIGPGRTFQRSAAAMLVAGLVHGLIDNSFFLADLACFTWIGLSLGTPTDIGGDSHAA